MALIENVQRQDPTPLEEAEGYRRPMAEFDYTQEVLAERIGKSRPAVANLLRLLDLAGAGIRSLIAEGRLGRPCLRADDLRRPGGSPEEVGGQGSERAADRGPAQLSRLETEDGPGAAAESRSKPKDADTEGARSRSHAEAGLKGNRPLTARVAGRRHRAANSSSSTTSSPN